MIFQWPLKEDWKGKGVWGKLSTWLNTISAVMNGMEVMTGGRVDITDQGAKFYIGTGYSDEWTVRKKADSDTIITVQDGHYEYG